MTAVRAMMRVWVGQPVRVQGHSAAWYGVVTKIYAKTVTIRATDGGRVSGVPIADLSAWHHGKAV